MRNTDVVGEAQAPQQSEEGIKQYSRSGSTLAQPEIQTIS